MTATWSTLAARTRRSVQALTEAAPSAADDGIDLSDVGAVVPVVHAPAGQTFSGGGTLLGYVRPPLGGAAWIRQPTADVDLSDVAGLSDATLVALAVSSPTGRFALIANAVTVSSGAAITLELVCTSRIRGEAL